MYSVVRDQTRELTIVIRESLEAVSIRDFQITNLDLYQFSGDCIGRVTPVPIPNTVVKPA